MKAVLMSFGYIVSGPKGNSWVFDLAEAEQFIKAEIEQQEEAEFWDRDDYTTTEVFAKAWRGRVESPIKDWDESFKEGVSE